MERTLEQRDQIAALPPPSSSLRGGPGTPARAGGDPVRAEHVLLRHIRKTFGSSVAVDDVSFAVGDGEFVVLLGPSGCGKTTTLRMIAGLDEPDAGELVIRGEVVTGKPPYRRDVGVVFQNYALFPHMTVFENVAYGLRMRGVARDDLNRRVAAAIELVQLSGLEGRLPRQLSGGQQQRVAVARAVVIRPSVLLLDEPLSNLDARLRRTMRAEIRRLQRALGIAAIFVTHDQEEALSIADRVIVMNRGRIEQIGTPLNVYLRPSSPFVAEFIGECNFIDGEVVKVSGGAGVFRSGRGLEFLIDVPAAVRAGTRGTVAIRPENVSILPRGGAPAAGTNVVQGKVASSVYLGPFRHVRVTLDGGQDLLLYEQAGFGGSSQGAAPPEGGAVSVSWWPAACMFYPSPGGRAER